MRIFIDCTDTHFSRSNSGIQRVVRNVVAHARSAGIAVGVECIPVIYEGGCFWPITVLNTSSIGTARRTARNRLDELYWRWAQALARVFPLAKRFLLAHRRDFGLAQLLHAPIALWKRWRARRAAVGHPADIGVGDVLFLPDACWFTNFLNAVAETRARGGRVALLLYDLIPLTHPQFCQPSHVVRFQRWLKQIRSMTDLLLTISEATLSSYRHLPFSTPLPPHAVTYLGRDLPTPATGTVRNVALRTSLDTTEPIFLCVGTIDPRKNQASVVTAFEQLWDIGVKARLILIGSAGLRSDEILPRVRAHPMFERNLFWFDDIDDGDLVLAYARGRALIFPSIIEGFGLPIVEALALGISVIASDISVFREIGQSWVRYFDPNDPASIARCVSETLTEPRSVDAARERTFRWMSWEESARGMIAALVKLSGT